jgi:hypothetical protein
MPVNQAALRKALQQDPTAYVRHQAGVCERRQEGKNGNKPKVITRETLRLIGQKLNLM